MTGNAQWFTLPVGVTVLIVVSLARWDRQRHGQDRATPPLVALEYLGMLLIVSPALVQIVALDLGYVLLAIAEGAALVMWGVITRVRRRALFGAAAIGVGAALTLVVPLVGLAPKVRGPWLWLTIAAIGLVTVLVAAFLEQGRGAARAGRDQAA